MKLIKKSTIFNRAKVEMSKEEYKAFMLGSYFGKIDGFTIGVIVSIVVISFIHFVFF